MAARQARTEDDNEVADLTEWVDWDMPLFKLLQAATVQEEWLGMLLELFREICWRFRHLGKDVLTKIVCGAYTDSPGIIWAPDFGRRLCMTYKPMYIKLMKCVLGSS